MDWIEHDKQSFKSKKAEISGALIGLKTGMLNGVNDQNREEPFYMLIFCLLVPQSKQIQAEKIVQQLRKIDYYNNDILIENLSEIIKGKVRFHNRKANYISEFRRKFKNDNFWGMLKQKYHTYIESNRSIQVLFDIRKWLIKEIKGVSFKLSSHFLRNIGMRGLAILDVHILRSMSERNLISNYLPLTESKYYNIEKKLQGYAKALEVEIDELDQLFWSNATGYVGK